MTPPETAHRACWWCGELRHRSDMKLVDDHWMCLPDVDECIEEYFDANPPRPVPKSLSRFEHG